MPKPEATDPFPDWRSKPTMDGTRPGPEIVPGVKGPPVRVNISVVNQVKLKGKGQRGNSLTHREFYAVPLYLNVGMDAATKALESFAAIDFHETKTATGIDRDVKHTSHGHFLSFLQQSLVAITFSFQAIEAFANAVIGDELAGGQFFDGSKRGKPATFTASGVQRDYSTERKLTEALPQLTGENPIKKDFQLWRDFKELLDLRNEAIHLKWERQQRALQPGVLLDDHTLWHLIVNTEIVKHPKTAAHVIHHFSRKLEPVPPWLWHIIDEFGIPDARSRDEPGSSVTTNRIQRR